jgi:hypothetical protein
MCSRASARARAPIAPRRFGGAQECKVPACYDDGGDCDKQNCAPGCDEGWVGDEYCDEACFVEACNWDGGDCSEKQGCNTGCLPEYINDGECDVYVTLPPRASPALSHAPSPSARAIALPLTCALRRAALAVRARRPRPLALSPRSECNVAACGFDGDDCFHAATECYGESDGSDYRGSKNKTKSGKECQAWDSQFPQQHTRTHLNFPDGGLGGHNFCRNPDGETAPWCYTTDPVLRWEYCNIGQPWQHCKRNEIPRAVQVAGGKQCLTPTTPPSGPLPQFEAKCGKGDNHGDICSRECCNAAKAANAFCANDDDHFGRYQEFKMKIAFSQLKFKCTTCVAFSDFFSNAETIMGMGGGAGLVRFADSVGFTVLVAAFIIMLLMLCVIAASIARYVWQRRQYAMPESAV